MDFGLLAQSEKITGWLTPVWMISVGIAAGYVLVLILKVLIRLATKISVINELNENPRSRTIVGLILGAVVACLIATGFYLSGSLAEFQTEGIILFAFLTLVVSLILGFGLVALVSKKRFGEINNQPRGSFPTWLAGIGITSIVIAVAGYGLAMVNGFGYVIMVDNPNELFESLGRLPRTGIYREEVKVPANSTATLKTSFYGQEFKEIVYKSDQRVIFSTKPIDDDYDSEETLEMFPSRSENEMVIYRKRDEDERFPAGVISNFYFKNMSSGDADVSLIWRTQVAYPQISIVPKAAIAVILIFLAYWIFCSGLPKIAAIAISTFKTEISQPVFILLLLIGVFFAVGSIYIPYNTFGEDIKMYKLSGLTLIRILGIFMAIWAASKSVAEEIEGRTALTVLSKPVGRRQFILGKFSGIALAIGLLFILLGIWFTIWVCYKPIYDGVETTTKDFGWVQGFNEAVKTMPGIALAYLESLVFVAISIAISTRMGILPNFMICFAIYVLGHLTPLIVQSAEVAQSFEAVVVFGQLISVIFPVLDHFDVEPAIIGDVDVPLAYLGWATVYCLIYGTIAMLLSLVFFEDRDLA